MSQRRVVITGVGLVTPVGLDPESTWKALVAGESGAAPITLFDASEHDVRFACEVKDFEPERYMERKEARRADRFLQLAMASAGQAMESADWPRVGAPQTRPELVSSSARGSAGSRFSRNNIKVARARSAPSFALLHPDVHRGYVGGMVSMKYGAQGPNYATVSACASSAHAIGLAFRSVRYGEADVMITGGTESTITGLCVAGFSTMRAMSPRNDSPETASDRFVRHGTGSCWVRGQECSSSRNSSMQRLVERRFW